MEKICNRKIKKKIIDSKEVMQKYILRFSSFIDVNDFSNNSFNFYIII